MDVTSYLLGKKNGGGGVTPTGTINISSNGETNVTNYATANVNVQPDLETKSVTITENTTTTISPTQGKDGLSSVEVITNVSGSGYKDNDVNFYDYDGTIVYSCSASDFANMTEMPANPTHEGLTAEGWNWSLANAKQYVQKYGLVEIGQTYHTTDGKIHIYVDIPANNYLLYVGVKSDKQSTIEWNDNTADSTVVATYGNEKFTAHTYATKGKYVIKISSEGTFTIRGGGDNNVCNLISNKNGVPDAKCLQSKIVYKIELPQNVAIGSSAFARLYNLKTIAIPKDVTTSSGSFAYDYSLIHINLYSTTQLSNNNIVSCSANMKSISFGDYETSTLGTNLFATTPIKKVSFRYTGTSFGASFTNSCIENMIIPDSVTTMSNAFIGTNNYLIRKVVFPTNLTDMSSASVNDYCRVYDFRKCTSVPTTGTNTLGNTTNTSTIVVPDNLYDTWIESGNWATASYSGRIIRASDYTEN